MILFVMRALTCGLVLSRSKSDSVVAFGAAQGTHAQGLQAIHSSTYQQQPCMAEWEHV